MNRFERYERRAWTLHAVSQLMVCPECAQKGQEAEHQAVLRHYAQGGELLAAAEPVERYGSPPKAKPLQDTGNDALAQQYNRIKAQYPDAILLFRIGDEYVSFNTDADRVYAVLGLVKTSIAGDNVRASFHFSALEDYLPRLVRAGNRVAICDQLMPPKPQSIHDPALYGNEHDHFGMVGEPVEQYRRIKPLYKDALLVLRDHQGYLMLYKDAERAAAVLDIDFDRHGPMRIAKSMLEPVLNQLVHAGHRVAVVIDPIVNDPRNGAQVDMYDEIHETAEA